MTKGYNLSEFGFKFSGAYHVLRNIISYDYLWNRIRVQGGAYGAFLTIERSGNCSMLSYRDPDLAGTLKVYDGLPDYLEKFDPTKREMDKYIIGTIGDLEPVLSPKDKGIRALYDYFKGVTDKDRQREKEEVLSLKKEDVTSLSGIFRKALSKNCFCVIGSESKINAEKDIFGKILKLN